MNVVRWKIVNDVREKLPDVTVRYTYGSPTARTRKILGIEESHANDAYCSGNFHPLFRSETVNFKNHRRNNCFLEKFYDAKMYDICDGKIKSGQELG